jgi:hypothetical protein
MARGGGAVEVVARGGGGALAMTASGGGAVEMVCGGGAVEATRRAEVGEAVGCGPCLGHKQMGLPASV